MKFPQKLFDIVWSLNVVGQKGLGNEFMECVDA